MRMPERPEVELPPLPPMGYGNEGYSVLAMQEYAVAYAEKFAAIYGQAVREECAKVCEEVNATTGECPELAIYCAAAIRAKE